MDLAHCRQELPARPHLEQDNLWSEGVQQAHNLVGIAVAGQGSVNNHIFALHADLLNLFRKVFFGPVTREVNKTLKDMDLRELATTLPLIAFIFIIGLWPNAFLEPMHASVDNLLEDTRLEINCVRDTERMQKVDPNICAGVVGVAEADPLIRVGNPAAISIAATDGDPDSNTPAK